MKLGNKEGSWTSYSVSHPCYRPGYLDPGIVNDLPRITWLISDKMTLNTFEDELSNMAL